MSESSRSSEASCRKCRYVWPQRGLFLLFVTATVGILFVQPALTFLPLMVTQHFGGKAMELGWTQSAYGSGYIAGTALVGLATANSIRTICCVAICPSFIPLR
jgi:hypothetical protein